MFTIRRNFSEFHKICTIVKTKKPGDKLGINGWIQNIRRLKNNLFLDVNDGTICKKFQIVVAKTDQTKELTTGSSIRAIGSIHLAPNGSFELHADDVQLIADGHLAEGYPFSPKQQHLPEYVREYLHLRSRVDYFAAQMRLRHRAQKAIHDYMDALGFTHIHTPILSTNDCEGAGEVFSVRPDSDALLKDMSRTNSDVPLEHSYFNKKVFLSVSGQLHLEAMCYGLGNTYTIASAFRAENCKSPLHLSEFYMFEAELIAMDNLKALASFIELMIKSVTRRVLDTCEDDLAFCQKKAVGDVFKLTWLQKPWTTLTYDEALQIVLANKSQFKTEIKPSEGFSKEQELFLVEHCGTPVFVVDWPANQKPFYVQISQENPRIVYALDLLMPNVGELCGGSLREYDYQRLKAHANLPKGLNWYLELRKYGGIPTGGFGMGLERYLQLLSGVKNIRDVIPYPRYPHSCKM